MSSYHMSADDFRRHGRELIDWIADYWESVEDLRIVPEIEPGDIREHMPNQAPEHPEPFEQVLDDLDRVVMDGLTHWQSPGWFAYFPANASFPSILGELAAAGLGQQGMLWSTSPASTEVESQVLDWLVDLLGLPATWKTTDRGGGVIQMSASDATHTALVVSRHVASHRAGVDRLVAYTSQQAHSSIEKGARIAGFQHLRLIDVDDHYAMVPEALEEAMNMDVGRGLTPAFIGSTVGTTGTTAIDPIRDLAAIARRFDVWHHVDAAYAGSAMICPEFRHLQDGVELVDSYTFNPHKWMFTNFDCNVFYVRDRAPLIETLSILPPYLKNKASESGQVIDYRDWHVPLGRRFRALKLWFVLRSYGAEGIRHHIRVHVSLARDLEARLRRRRQVRVGGSHTPGTRHFPPRRGERCDGLVRGRDQRFGSLLCDAFEAGGRLVHPGLNRSDPQRAASPESPVVGDRREGLSSVSSGWRRVGPPGGRIDRVRSR